MTRGAIAAIGVAGGLFLGRTALYYAPLDRLAFALVLTMAVVFFAGVAELFVRARETRDLGDEAARVARASDPSAAAGPRLRARIEARLAQAGSVAAPPLVASYFAGMLVMLGLLGTFLGLFETLRGAREALVASADLDALRAGLTQPMQGLTRSFGSSAAGVASSALLGLALVLVRRDEARLAAAVHAIAVGPLASRLPGSRQLALLERIAAQGEALPRAATALTDAAAALRALEDTWAAQHAKASREATAALGAAVADVRADLARGVDAAATRLDGAASRIDALAAAWSAAHDRAARDQAAALAAAVDALRADLARGIATTASGLDEARARLDALATTWSTQHDAAARATRDALESAVAELSAGLARGVDASTARFDGAASRLDALAATWAAAHDDARRAITTSLAAATDALRADLARGIGATTTRLDGSATRLDALATTWAAAHDEASRAITASLTAATDALRADLSRGIDATASALDGVHGRLDALAKSWGAQHDATAQATRDALRAAVDEVRADLARGIDVAGVAMRDAVTPPLEAATARLTSLVGRELTELRAGEDAARAARIAAEEDAATRVARCFDALADAEATRAAAAAEAHAAMDRTLAAIGDAVRARLAASDARDEANAARAGELITRVDALRAAVAESNAAADGRLDALLTRVGASVDAQAANLAQLENDIKDVHVRTTDDVARALVRHASEVEAQLTAAATTVHEGAAQVAGGGAELTALAELFAESVDRHRAAADAWLEGLTRVEPAITVAGERAAADALRDHLTRTCEIFERQLHFQRELFEQLRALRDDGDGEDVHAVG